MSLLDSAEAFVDSAAACVWPVLKSEKQQLVETKQQIIPLKAG